MHEWRGTADVIAVGFYLLGVIPLVGIALVDMNILAHNEDPREKLKLHATFVGIFLVFAHVAMIFGMLSPSVLGYQEKVSPMNMNNSLMEMNHADIY